MTFLVFLDRWAGPGKLPYPSVLMQFSFALIFPHMSKPLLDLRYFNIKYKKKKIAFLALEPGQIQREQGMGLGLHRWLLGEDLIFWLKSLISWGVRPFRFYLSFFPLTSSLHKTSRLWTSLWSDIQILWMVESAISGRTCCWAKKCVSKAKFISFTFIHSLVIFISVFTDAGPE